ncbi:MAG: hypothetical protein LLG44_00030 [Chloroflexi bacterium]|nr:hypothetical protein [Chloroflexota bacterium]
MTTSDNTVKRPDGVTVIAVVQFILGGLGIVALAVMLIVGVVMAAASANAGWLSLLALFMGGLLIAACSVLAIAAGVGLLQLRNWARWVTIILAILCLAGFPVGTVIGALIIWYLLQDGVAALFEKRAVVQPAQPTQSAKPVQIIEAVQPAQPESSADVTVPPAE